MGTWTVRRTMAAAVVTGLLATQAPAPAQRGEARRASTAPGIVPADVADRYLAVRPPLGPVTVVDVAGESADRLLLATTLQGTVNRTSARIYLLGARSRAEDQRWIDDYLTRGLITVAETIDLDAALGEFAAELDGYVVADPTEPWTVNTATTVAGVRRGVVATPSTLGAVQAAGLAELEDHRGRWSDAATAYASVLADHRGELRLATTALQQPDRHAPRDLYVQQGLFVAYTRPAQADFDAVYDLLETLPADHPLYGYVSDTGEEEVQAIIRLSLDGRFLIPTDTASNLSFHLAVGGSERAVPTPTEADVAPCRPDDLNVVLALSDGDNLTIPLAYDPRPENWASPRRGELPVGWGITPAASILLPAIWDRYVGETTDADEIVDIMGLGYSYGSAMPNAAAHHAAGERLRAALGVRAHWSLDALLSEPDAGGWDAVEGAWASTGERPSGVLLNYGVWPGPAWFRTDTGVPVLASRQDSYDDGPAELAAQLRRLQEADPADRPLVSFFAVTVWTSTYDELVTAMAPLQAEGVRFLTPSEAFACLPADDGRAPGSSTTTTAAPAPTEPTPGPEAPAAGPIDGAATYVG
ncbi:MAG TPA: GxGYxYP family putative glycoside hydrolase [Aquihabitans sp.]|nr:GxGYxYP family putative glycoside hydrolase [Aquihabitans sp.]